MKKSLDPTKKETDFSFSHRKEGFDNHIGLSIRGYDHLHQDVVSMSRYFVESGTSVVDIGSSTGKTMMAMAKQNHCFAPTATYFGIEPALGFESAMNKTVKDMRDAGYNAEFLKEDVTQTYLPYNCSYVTSLFTLQFISKSSREYVIQQVHEQLIPGGAFVFAEKVFSTDAQLQDMFTFLYYDYKRKSFTEKDILDKESELRNMLKPSKWQDIRQQLERAGFSKIDTFWKSYNFVGGIAIK